MVGDNEVRDISANFKIEHSGLSVGGKSRALTVLDNLLGSGLDIFAQPMAMLAQYLQHKSERQQIRLQADIDREQRAIARFTSNEVRKQENLDAIAAKIQEELMAPDISTQDEGTRDDSARIDPDWLNKFTNYAAEATSEQLREMWAKIAAGEIRRVGSFSRSTLRVISELDAEVAAKFQNLMINRLHEGILPRPAGITNQELFDLSLLEEVGLLQSINGELEHSVPVRDGACVYYNGSAGLKVVVDHPLSITIAMITRVGREICSILPPEPDDRSLRYIATMLPEGSRIELGKLVGFTPDGLTKKFLTTEVLRDR